MTWIIILIVVFTILTLVLGNVKKEKKGGARNPIKGKRILTMNEQPTFFRLREALPEHIILAQIIESEVPEKTVLVSEAFVFETESNEQKVL
ncbi:hypothetical protein PJ15_1747 [Acinetobacter sp. neg1]|nr:hypothetical protein PJ15_1747 [Acinetobacter sp. neg1]